MALDRSLNENAWMRQHVIPADIEGEIEALKRRYRFLDKARRRERESGLPTVPELEFMYYDVSRRLVHLVALQTAQNECADYWYATNGENYRLYLAEAVEDERELSAEAASLKRAMSHSTENEALAGAVASLERDRKTLDALETMQRLSQREDLVESVDFDTEKLEVEIDKKRQTVEHLSRLVQDLEAGRDIQSVEDAYIATAYEALVLRRRIAEFSTAIKKTRQVCVTKALWNWYSSYPHGDIDLCLGRVGNVAKWSLQTEDKRRWGLAGFYKFSGDKNEQGEWSGTGEVEFYPPVNLDFGAISHALLSTIPIRTSVTGAYLAVGGEFIKGADGSPGIRAEYDLCPESDVPVLIEDETRISLSQCALGEVSMLVQLHIYMGKEPPYALWDSFVGPYILYGAWSKGENDEQDECGQATRRSPTSRVRRRASICRDTRLR